MIQLKFPTKYIAFTQYFHNGHKAVDIANAVTVDGVKYDNKDVFMAYEGKVITNAYASDYGYFVEYEVKDGNDTYVIADGHFDTPSDLKVGETYPQGTFIHRMGNKGTSTSCHDHHRITLNGIRVNPLDYECVYPDQIVGSLENAELKYYVEPTPEPEPIEDEFKIGDRVCVKGYSTSASDGSGEHTAEYGGNPDDESDIRYITLINEGAIRPYHISVGQTQGDRDRGWVSKDQLTKLN